MIKIIELKGVKSVEGKGGGLEKLDSIKGKNE